MQLKTSSPKIVHTKPCTHRITSLGPLWPEKMNDSVARMRRKLVKTFKNVLPEKWTEVAEVCRDTFSKKDDR